MSKLKATPVEAPATQERKLKICVKLKSKENIKSLDDMTPTTMRQLWTMIESTQVSTLLQLDDISLVQWLLKQLTAQQALDEPEISSLSSYISSRLHLIRDTAFSRNSAGPENH